MEFALLNNQPTDHIQMELQQLQAEFFKGKMKRGTDGSSTTTASTNQIGQEALAVGMGVASPKSQNQLVTNN